MQSDQSIRKLTVKREVNPSTGTPDAHYYWESQLAPKIEIVGKLVDKLSGYTLIKKDLDNALRWIQRAEQMMAEQATEVTQPYFVSGDREIADLVKAYFVASLTFYGKCFTEAAGRHAQVSRDWLDPEHRGLHDYYMNFRHNFAAHSGAERLELAKTFVLLHPNKKSLLPYLPTLRLQPDVAVPEAGEKGFRELIETVSALVVERYNKLADKIIEEDILSRDPSFWSAAAEAGKPVLLDLPRKPKGVKR